MEPVLGVTLSSRNRRLRQDTYAGEAIKEESTIRKTRVKKEFTLDLVKIDNILHPLTLRAQSLAADLYGAEVSMKQEDADDIYGVLKCVKQAQAFVQEIEKLNKCIKEQLLQTLKETVS